MLTGPEPAVVKAWDKNAGNGMSSFPELERSDNGLLVTRLEEETRSIAMTTAIVPQCIPYRGVMTITRIVRVSVSECKSESLVSWKKKGGERKKQKKSTGTDFLCIDEGLCINMLVVRPFQIRYLL